MDQLNLIETPAKRWKTVLFIIFAPLFALGGLFLLESVPEGLLPWVTIGCPGCDIDNPNYNVDLYRFFGAEHGALVGIMFSGSLISLLWKPWTKPLLLQFYILGHIIFLVSGYLIGVGNPDALPFIDLILLTPSALLAATYPGKGLWHNMFKQANYHRPLLLLTLVAFILLVPGKWHQLMLQINVVDEFAQYNRWSESVQLFLILIFAGILAAARKPGWKQLAALIGIVYVFLGAAAITVPDQEGSWGIYGGILSILGGVCYIGIAANRLKIKGIKSEHEAIGGGTEAGRI